MRRITLILFIVFGIVAGLTLPWYVMDGQFVPANNSETNASVGTTTTPDELPATTTTTTTPTPTTPRPTATVTQTDPPASATVPLDPDDPGETVYRRGNTTFNSTTIERLVHYRVNEIRVHKNLSVLSYNTTIASVSRAHSVDMKNQEYFAHVNREDERPWDRYNDVAGNCRMYGENIHQTFGEARVRLNFTTEQLDTEESSENGTYTVVVDSNEELAEEIVQSFMHSPPHRKNMLRDNWDEQGIGIYITTTTLENNQTVAKVWATQNFCDRP